MFPSPAQTLATYCAGMAGIDRRRFLSGSGALMATALAARSDPASRPLQPDNWQSVRDQFALDPDIAHFAAYVLASPPKLVRDAIERHRRGLDADTSGYLEQLSDTPVRRAVISDGVAGAPARRLDFGDTAVPVP